MFCPQGNTPSGPADQEPTVTKDDLDVLIKLQDTCGLDRDLSHDGSFWRRVELKDGRVVGLRFRDCNLRGETSPSVSGSKGVYLLWSTGGCGWSLRCAGFVGERPDPLLAFPELSQLEDR